MHRGDKPAYGAINANAALMCDVINANGKRKIHLNEVECCPRNI